MKKVAFLFLAILLSASPMWAESASAVASTDITMDVVLADESAPKVCTITIKGTYKGDPIDLVVTVEADNCAQAAADFLKRMASK